MTTDDDRIRVMRAIRDAARTASGNNLALATGAVTGVLAMLIQESDPGPEDLLELVIAKLHELVPPTRGVTHGPVVRCIEMRCRETIHMEKISKKSKWFHGSIGWLCPRHAP